MVSAVRGEDGSKKGGKRKKKSVMMEKIKAR